MKNFEEQIRQSYKGMKTPEFSEAAWDKFQSHAQSKVKKSSRKVMLILMGLIMVLSSVVFNVYQFSLKANQAELTNHSAKRANLKIAASPVSKIDNEISEKPLSKNIQDQFSNRKNTSNKIVTNENDIQNKLAKNLIIPKNYIEEHIDQIAKNKEQESNENPNQIQKLNIQAPLVKIVDRAEISKTPLIVARGLEIEKPEIRLTYSIEPIVPIRKNVINHGFSYALTGSYGYLDHRVIESNSLFNIQNSLYYNYGKHFRIKADLGFDNIQYDSRIFSLNLGIEGRVAESRSLKFQKVKNEINKIELGLGFDLISPELFGISIFAGPSLVYGREISRTLHYQFEDKENMAIETLLENNYELQRFPLNLRKDIGLMYSLNNKYRLQCILSHLNQIKKSGYDMPNETSYSFGIEIKI